MIFSFFTADAADPDLLHPQDMAKSLWSDKQMHGVAISGAIGRGIERAVAVAGRDDLQPARLTVELFAAAAMVPSRVRTRVVREGRRLILVDGELVQGEGDDEKIVARTSAMFLKPSASPEGLVWSSEEVPQVPPLDTVPPTDTPRVPFLRSAKDWSQNFMEHANDGRKMMWQAVPPVVDGEEQSWFVSAAAVADSSSMVVNWGSKGVEFINTDITIAFSRPFIGGEIGLEARDRFEAAGISVGSTVLIDRTGPVGISMVTAMANAQRTVTFEGAEYNDAPVA